MSKETKQVIVSIGGEGGSITLFGFKDIEGKWQFMLNTDESVMSDFDNTLTPEDVIRNSGIVSTWEGAIKLLDRYPWISLIPLEVHSEFRNKIWESILDHGKKLEGHQIPGWLKSLERWCEVCFAPINFR